MFNTGNGILQRDIGRYPPAMRKLLSEVGNETITKITLYKYPLVAVSALAKFFSNKKIPYDELFHLGVNINDKYNLDKDEVLHFARGNIQSTNKPGFVTMNVDKVSSQPKLTINALLEQTRLRIGDEKMTEYSAFRNNCQSFVKNLLVTGNWSTQDTTKFIDQNAQSFLKDLPPGTEPIVDAITKTGAIIDRQIHGEGLYTEDDDIYIEDTDGTGLTTEYILPIANTEGDPPATGTDFYIRAESGYANPDQVDVEDRVIGRTVFGGGWGVQNSSMAWGVDGKERPYFGSGIPSTSNFKMYGTGVLNYPETKVNEIGNEVRYNFDTAIPKRLQEYSLANYQIRGGSSGLTYTGVKANPYRDYLLAPIDTITNAKF